LQRQRPASTTDPHLVSDVVAAQLNHEAEVLAVQREVEALQRILDGRRAEQAALKRIIGGCASVRTSSGNMMYRSCSAGSSKFATS